MQIIPFFHQRRFGEWPASQASDWHQQTWVWYDSLFYSIQLSLRKFWFDTTHDSQWRYRNWFKSTEYSKCISEIFSNQLMTQKKNFQNLELNQLMTQWCYSFPVSYDLFWAFNLFLKTFSFFGHSTQLLTWWPILVTYFGDLVLKC